MSCPTTTTTTTERMWKSRQCHWSLVCEVCQHLISRITRYKSLMTMNKKAQGKSLNVMSDLWDRDLKFLIYFSLLPGYRGLCTEGCLRDGEVELMLKMDPKKSRLEQPFMVDRTAANTRIMTKLLLERRLVTKHTPQYLPYTEIVSW